MLQSTRLKYHEQQKGHNIGIATRGSKANLGKFGLKAVDRGRLTARQIEATRRTMTRRIKRGGRTWIRVFPNKPITEKPIRVCMGGSKGNAGYYTAEIRPGKVLYEMGGVPETLAREAFELVATELPIPTTFVARQVGQ